MYIDTVKMTLLFDVEGEALRGETLQLSNAVRGKGCKMQ